MFENGEIFKLTNLIDINFLQRIQDDFSSTVRIATVIFDDEGIITESSNFDKSCFKYKDSKLFKNNNCNIEEIEIDLINEKPINHKYNLALNHIVIPIFIEKKQIASIFGVEIKSENTEEKLEINSKDTFSAKIRLLKCIANTISEIATKNYELNKKNKREEILKNIIKEIRSLFDVNEIKKYFINIVYDYFSPDRCLFANFDESKGLFLPFEIERLKADNIKSLIGIDSEVKFPEFSNRLKAGKNIIIKDLNRVFLKENLSNYKAINFLMQLGIKSDYGFSIKHKEEFMGALVLHFTNKTVKLSKDDLEFLNAIIAHAGTALYQAKLYIDAQNQIEKLKLIQNITETIRTSLDIGRTKEIIVETIAKALKADECFIADYDKKTNEYLPIQYEYVTTPYEKRYKGSDLKDFFPSLVNASKLGKNIFVQDGKIKFDDELQDLDDEVKVITSLGIASGIAFPFYFKDELLGILSIGYSEKNDYGWEKEVEFMKTLANQIAMAIHQSQLYTRVQIQAEREKINRNIIEILRSTLDKKIIKSLFVKNIGKFFNADRVIFSEYDQKNKTYKPITTDSQYLSFEEKSFTEYDWDDSILKEHFYPLMEKRELLIPNWEKYINSNEINPNLKNLFIEEKIKSSYGFPVLYEGNIMGFFCIDFTKVTVELPDEDIKRVRNICTQAGIALYHADLYFKAQKALNLRDEIITKVKIGVKEPVNDIINSCNQLLELTNTITEEDENSNGY